VPAVHRQSGRGGQADPGCSDFDTYSTLGFLLLPKVTYIPGLVRAPPGRWTGENIFLAPHPASGSSGPSGTASTNWLFSSTYTNGCCVGCIMAPGSPISSGTAATLDCLRGQILLLVSSPRIADPAGWQICRTSPHGLCKKPSGSCGFRRDMARRPTNAPTKLLVKPAAAGHMVPCDELHDHYVSSAPEISPGQAGEAGSDRS
jgi:hypothetical protein